MSFEPHLWGVVLSGGEGVRLKTLARRICGDERPKQYVPIFGNRTLLRQTLDRVALRIRSSQTAVVTLRSHSRFFVEQWAGSEPPRVLMQPTDRGTAAGILFPIHWIARQDPDAIVAVFPSDHFVSEPAGSFLRAAREAVPEVCERLARAVPFFESDAEAWAQAFALIPRADFSRAILEPCPPFLAVAAVPRRMWSDLGSPRRVFEILGGDRSLPAWAVAPDRSAS